MAVDTGPPNIYIIGPQSTGKTTLVNELRSGLHEWLTDPCIDKPQIIEETARMVIVQHNVKAEVARWSAEECLSLQRLILEAQASAEAKALQQSSWFISDRSGFDTMVYSRRYASVEASRELQQTSLWQEMKSRMEDSLVVVCEADTPWLTDDGLRLMPESRQAWMQLFHEF